MKSYRTPYASTTRASRVDAPLRRFESLAHMAPLETAPTFALTNESGDHVVLDDGSRYRVHAANGAKTAEGGKDNVPALVWAASLVVNGREYDFADNPGPGVVVAMPGSRADKSWAFEMSPTETGWVLQLGNRPVPGGVPQPGGGWVRVWNDTPDEVSLLWARFAPPGSGFTQPVVTATIAGRGCGAIADDRRFAVAMFDQRFFVYDPARPVDQASGQSVPTAAAKLAFVPYDISVVDGGVALLSGGQSRGVVHLLDWQGHEQWEASIPFDVDSPPIDAGGGRVFLVGSGFAAAEHGKTLWAQPSRAHTFATALADGSVLVATGPELRAVSRDGVIRQTLRIPEGDAIVTPPAVAADGSAWVATAKGLYRAR
jgi:hypothetical protein